MSKNSEAFNLDAFPSHVAAAIRRLQKQPEMPAKTASVRLAGIELAIMKKFDDTRGLTDSEILKRGLRALELLDILLDKSTKISADQKDGTVYDLTNIARDITGRNDNTIGPEPIKP